MYVYNEGIFSFGTKLVEKVCTAIRRNESGTATNPE
jgi:hypothetical protein